MQKTFDWNFKVGTIAGIDIRLHWMLLGYMIFQLADWARHGQLIYGAELMLALWLIILLHELGHCFMARRRKQSVKEIILWPLGGLAMVGQSRSHDDNIWIAFAGPAVNLAIAALLLAALYATGQQVDFSLLQLTPPYGDSLLRDVFNMNYVMILLNLFLPIFPLDGGRIFVGTLSKYLQEYRVLMIAGVTTILGGLGISLWALSQNNFINFGAALTLAMQGELMRQRGIARRFKVGKKPDMLEVLTTDLQQKQFAISPENQQRANKAVTELLDNLTKPKSGASESEGQTSRTTKADEAAN